MTKLIEQPVETHTVENAHLAAATLDDVPAPMRLTSLAYQIRRQTRTAAELGEAATNAIAEVKRRRS
ncbi:hypothetical protein [Streptomyces sp. NPDC047009]|uniref:hypothetical protein n=1 Tax=Streptomyces sp. NPDC047009 TaxID=3154496 RepID=UPI0033C220C0